MTNRSRAKTDNECYRESDEGHAVLGWEDMRASKTGGQYKQGDVGSKVGPQLLSVPPSRVRSARVERVYCRSFGARLGFDPDSSSGLKAGGYLPFEGSRACLRSEQSTGHNSGSLALLATFHRPADATRVSYSSNSPTSTKSSGDGRPVWADSVSPRWMRRSSGDAVMDPRSEWTYWSVTSID